ncbi:hypothetical protein HYPSUDRAFT_143895 [Hypholoma sublateritium FD-334 SS-4]|uniref:Ketoreductase (KR) domain-containing protein n=1 Tax=Hypholoma sublateritium (strain FD-334 SS-4) TaxID=945553 RepID=A0A0D2PGT8_HYPSF|nr:hypothetical protein HYPSUDRAFT_143924 [Hypholoma sublateritium FD-334 SS-4]KJA19316.1 hypothetical protein HYPSUDRAFT_143895 [Hypholoma sublateritium FD-334 SS-4]
MSSSTSTVYLVTGTNRGIGTHFRYIAASRPNAFVYAGVRDVSKAAALDELSKKHPGRISVVKCVSADVEGNAQLAKEIQARHGRVDTVIANAAVARVETTVLDTPAKELDEHFTVNVVGTAVLFQALHALLKASPSPRFIPISSASASIGGPMMPLPVRVATYGASKAALNYITRKIHFENEWLVAFPLAPGVVNTDSAKAAMANDTTGVFDSLREHITLQTPEEAAKALVDLIDRATREKEGGEFVDVDGGRIPW